jgi:hypothetical protein
MLRSIPGAANYIRERIALLNVFGAPRVLFGNSLMRGYLVTADLGIYNCGKNEGM